MTMYAMYKYGMMTEVKYGCGYYFVYRHPKRREK